MPLLHLLLALLLAATTLPAQSSRQALLSGELFATVQWLEPAAGGDREVVGGFGGRLLVHLGEAGISRSRAAVGAFASYTPERQGVVTWHYGAELDAHLAAAPIGGVLDPFLALGVGAWRERSRTLLQEVVATDIAISPAAGMYFRFVPALSVRSELRYVLIFASPTRNTLSGSLGLSLGF